MGQKQSNTRHEWDPAPRPYVGPAVGTLYGESYRRSSRSSVDRILVRAIYDFNFNRPDELPFRRGDVMEILDSMQSAWYYARHLRTKLEGFIPSNFVAIESQRPTNLDGWYDIGRREAERLLLRMGIPRGTYIIRPTTISSGYALSVRFKEEDRDMWVVKHYHIRYFDDGRYGIWDTRFDTVEELIKYFQEERVLCCCLTRPCPRSYQPPLQFRELEVNRESIQLQQRLGSGSFGEVWLGLWNGSLKVAVKTLRHGAMDPEQFMREARITHQLHHPHIVQLLGVCTTAPPIYIITELMPKGALNLFLQHDGGRQLRLNDLIDMMAQVAAGMAYLETKSYVHRDLRSANILVGENTELKVSDFGLARILEGDVYTRCGNTKLPIKWTAPEALMHQKFSTKSDVWSYGVLMYEVVTYGGEPYPGMPNDEVINKVKNGYHMEKPRCGSVACPALLYNLMLECWSLNPGARPTFDSLQRTFDDMSADGTINSRDPWASAHLN